MFGVEKGDKIKDGVKGKNVTVLETFGNCGNSDQVVILQIEDNKDISDGKNFYSICCKGSNYDEDIESFFNDINSTFNKYINALNYEEEGTHKKLFEEKTITFSGIPNSDYFGELGDKKCSKEFNVVDLFNAILLSQKEEELAKLKLTILMTDGVSKAYMYLNELNRGNESNRLKINLSIFEGLSLDKRKTICNCFTNILKNKIMSKEIVFKYKTEQEKNEEATNKMEKVACIGKKVESRIEKFFIEGWLNSNSNEAKTFRGLLKDNGKIQQTIISNKDLRSFSTRILDYIDSPAEENKEKLCKCCESYVSTVKNKKTEPTGINLEKSDTYIIFNRTSETLKKYKQSDKSEKEIKKEIAENILKDGDYQKNHSSLVCDYELYGNNRFKITIVSGGAKGYYVTGELIDGTTIEQILLDIPVFGLNNVIKSNKGFKLLNDENLIVNISEVKSNGDLYKALEFKKDKDVVTGLTSTSIGINNEIVMG